MSRDILTTRLAEFERSLRRVGLPELGGGNGGGSAPAPPLELDVVREAVPPRIWEDLARAFQFRANALVADVGDLRARLARLDDGEPDFEDALLDAWATYSEIEAGAGELFEEFTELMGGLAVRDRNRDTSFFSTADHLVRQCSGYTPHRDSLALAVPWMHDAVSRTLAKIVRLRFPDWTVWALPLGAGEFARVYLFLDRDNPRAIREYLRREMEVDNAGLADRASLLADAFGAYTQGPAYACAALRVRLRPDEAERAHVILATLKILEAGELDRYSREVGRLQREWEGCPGHRELDEGEVERLDRLARAAFDAFRRFLHINAPFSKSDWRRADDLRRSWEDNLTDRPGAPPDTLDSQTFTLRQVLNGAWLARLDGLAEPDVLVTAARAECERIVARGEQASSRGGGHAAAQPRDVGPGHQGAST